MDRGEPGVSPAGVGVYTLYMAKSSVVQKLAGRLEEWEPEVSREVEGLVSEIIELADLNVLDLARSRRIEQEVLDLLDEPITG